MQLHNRYGFGKDVFGVSVGGMIVLLNLLW